MKGCMLIVAIAALSFQVAAHAADSDAQLAAARELLGRMRFDAQIAEAKAQCQKMTKTITPESVYQSNPSQFGGITPQSRLWPSVVHAFQEFYNNTCEYMDGEALTTVAAQSYASTLSKQDLADVIKFYSSPVGKKLADAQVAAGAAFQKEAAARLAESYSRANDEFSKRLADLIKGSRKPSY
jgi:hypothetical protein